MQSIRRRTSVRWMLLLLGMGIIILTAMAPTATGRTPLNKPPAFDEQSVAMVITDDPYTKVSEHGIEMVRFNLRDSRVQPKVMLANNDQGGREAINLGSSYVHRLQSDNNVQYWALINADFIGSGCPSGVNCAQGLTFIDGNRKENWSQYGTTWEVRGSMGFNSSNGVEMNIGNAQSKTHMVFAGGPMLVRNGNPPECSATLQPDGKYHFTTGEQFENAGEWCGDTRAISFVAYSADEKYFYMGISKGGKTPVQVADWLRSQGAHQILRLDSGGSSRIIMNGTFVGGTSTSGSRQLPNAFAMTVSSGEPEDPYTPPCPILPMEEPANGATLTSTQITLRWSLPGGDCADRPIVVSIKTAPTIDGSGDTVATVVLGSTTTSHTVEIPTQYHNKDLYWSVWRERTGTGFQPPRTFKITPNAAPTIAVTAVNGQPVQGNPPTIVSNQSTWMIQGTAHDPDGNLQFIDTLCDGDSCPRWNRQAPAGSPWQQGLPPLRGINDVTITAVDSQQARSTPARLRFVIDQAAPQTTIALNGNTDRSRWPTWFTGPVHALMTSHDRGTMRATAGVKTIATSVNGEPSQIVAGVTAHRTITIDGVHTLRVMAEDHAQNLEDAQAITIQIDQTPPSPIQNLIETTGIPHDQWQGRNTPEFTWDASTDSGSGLARYELSWSPNPASTSVHIQIPATAARQWMPSPYGVASGTWYLRGRTVDIAGNTSAWTTLFILKYDGTPPLNPTDVSHANPLVLSTVPQRSTSIADFSWSHPDSDGLPIKGYYVYWGTDPQGISTTFITATTYRTSSPLCSADQSCTGYFRIRSIDTADRLAYAWSTVFVLRYSHLPGIDSPTYRIPTSALTPGAGTGQSPQYHLHATVGQAIETQPMSNAHYHLHSGFEPRRVDLDRNQVARTDDTTGNTCPVPQLRINEDQAFTHVPTVTLHICADHAVEMALSATPTFDTPVWEPITALRPWVLDTTPGTQVVYLIVREANGTVHRTYMDDIGYDPQPPTVTLAEDRVYGRTIDLHAYDAETSIAALHISTSDGLTTTGWISFTTPLTLPTLFDSSVDEVVVRVRDAASNESAPLEVTVDLAAPEGIIRFDAIAGPNTTLLTPTVVLTDHQSLHLHLRWAASAAGLDTGAWYVPSDVQILIAPGTEPRRTVWMQIRDGVGNLSEPQEVVYLVDRLPPTLDGSLQTANPDGVTIDLIAYDSMTDIATVTLSNDPLMLTDVHTFTTTIGIDWIFDERQVVWVQLEDTLGNHTTPIPLANTTIRTSSTMYLPHMRK